MEGSHPGLLPLLAAMPTVLSVTISPKDTKVRPAILGISSWAVTRILVVTAQDVACCVPFSPHQWRLIHMLEAGLSEHFNHF